MRKNNTTAVDWLVKRFLLSGNNLLISDVEEAKQMEKEQIIIAYKRERAYMKHAGCTDDQIDKSAKQYYNETYGKK